MIAKCGTVEEWGQQNWCYVMRHRNADKARELGAIALRLTYKVYAGNDRNEAHRVLKEKGYDLKKVIKKRSCDNSAYITLACLCAGITELEYSAEALREQALINLLPTIGFKRITERKYLTSEKLLKAGDILLKAGDCAIVTSDGVRS